MAKFCKILILPAILIFLVPFLVLPKNTAFEITAYLRFINDTTILYKDSEGLSPITFLPYSYYVNVLSYGDNFCHVECFGQNSAPAIDGYVATNALFNDNQSTDTPYLDLIVKTEKTCVLYEDANLSVNDSFIFKGRELTFYGYYKNSFNKYVCLVYYNGKLGYVEEDNLEPFEVPPHPNKLTFLDDENSENIPSFSITENEKGNSDSLGIRIAIICCLVLAGLIALIISIKPKKKINKDSFYDENDYE